MRPKHSLNHNIKSVPLVLTGNSQNICSSKLNAVVVPTGAIFDRHQIAAVRLATDGNELRFPSGVDDLIFERTQVRMLWPEGGDGIALTAARKGIAEKHVSPTERKRPISESRLVKWIASFDCAELEVLGKDDIWKRAKAEFPAYVISRQRVRGIVGARKSGPKPSRGKVTAS